MAAPTVDREAVLPLLHALQVDVDRWHNATQADLSIFHGRLQERIDGVRRHLLAGAAHGNLGGGMGGGVHQPEGAGIDPTLAMHRHRNTNINNGGQGSLPSTPAKRPHAQFNDANSSGTGGDYTPGGHHGPLHQLHQPHQQQNPHHHGALNSSGAGSASDNNWMMQLKDVLATPPHSNAARNFGGMGGVGRATPGGGGGGMDPYGASPSQQGQPPGERQQSLSIEQLFSRMAMANNAPPVNLDFLFDKDDSPGPANGGSGNGAHGGLGQGTGQSGRSASSASGHGGRTSIPIDSFMHIKGQAQTVSIHLSRTDSGRPAVVSVPGAPASADSAEHYNIDPRTMCQVLVEFKRKRVLQFEARSFVPPGEYVMVGGDRGEDLGLVIYTWCEARTGSVQGIGLAGSSLTRSIGVGNGKVLRMATPFEVAQLHRMQAELERRAVDVCQQRVLEHGLPMVIVDAEYQYDSKKLTFFYEAQQRLDFRELVRDLFKTFRARIWMELVEN